MGWEEAVKVGRSKTEGGDGGKKGDEMFHTSFARKSKSAVAITYAAVWR